MSAALDIVSIGMVTAVGLNAPSSCAAMRARVDGFQETRFRGPTGEWLIGAPIVLPRNWIGEKRLAHLTAAAICEAFETVPDARSDAALILCLAEKDRPGRDAIDETRLLRRVAGIAEMPAWEQAHIVAHGRPSGHAALHQARKLLASGERRYVMIAGTDSYLTTEAVTYYLDANRLLVPNNPNGFIPGEAAAAVLCARAPGSGLRLYGIGLAREDAYVYNDQDLPLRGDGMNSAYRSMLADANVALGNRSYRIADVIGEQYWFKQTALAAIRGNHDFQDMWSPTESVGNIGAAAVPTMIGMAWTAVKKGYAAGNPVVIEASGDTGACGAAFFAAGAA